MGVIISGVVWILCKILQIILILLAAVVLLCCIVLFVPIRYRAAVVRRDQWDIQTKVSWLCHIVTLTYTYQKNQASFNFKICGLDVFGWLKRRRKRKQKNKARKAAVSGQKNRAKKRPEKSRTENAQSAKDHQKNGRQKSAQSANGQPTASQLKNGQSANGQPTTSQSTAPESRLREIRNRLSSIRQFFSAIAGIIRKIYRKLNWLKDAKAFWRSENTRQMVCILKDNVLHLWRKIKPKTIRGDIIFGMEDPAATGQILGIAAVFYACYGKGISITPDFTEKKLEGNLLVKGRFSLATAVGIFFRILFSHSWKRFVRDFNQLKEAF